MFAVGATALAGVMIAQLAVAQEVPESLLPPGFDDPVPTPTPTPTRPPVPVAPLPAQPVVPGTAPAAPVPGLLPPGEEELPVDNTAPPLIELSEEELESLPTLEELEELSTDELDDLLGLTPKFDIPPAARRSMRRVGIIDPSEGGFPTQSLARQPASLVRAALSGTEGPLVSRWGHILLRRVVASRLAAPDGMTAVEFAALRVGLLNRIGEYSAARALAQDVDTGNWNDDLTSKAVTAYIAQSDLVGACPVVQLRRSSREDVEWRLLTAICNAYAGDTSLGNAQLVRLADRNEAPEIDVRLAQRYAGAAGFGRRGVEIEWEGVEGLNPWRFSLANAVGEPIPESLLGIRDRYYSRAGAVAPMLPLAQRASYSEVAASEGILSSRAMVELYSQIYADDGVTGDAASRAILLREAYVASEASDRMAAMRALWSQSDEAGGQGGYVMTAYAAARIAPNAVDPDDAADLIASMLTAGLDRDAESWSAFVTPGSEAWALLALARSESAPANSEAIDQFIDQDESDEQRKSAFLIAGLAALDRIPPSQGAGLIDRLDLDLDRRTRWTRMITLAADARNPALVAMLTGLGMQGREWAQMTPLHLYHIVASLNRIGLQAEARMIAAEAVARS